MLNKFVTKEIVIECLEELIENDVEWADYASEVTERIVAMAEMDDVLLDEDEVNDKVCKIMNKM